MVKHTRKTVQDETRYCEQCGISYIWTIEEQRFPVLGHSTQIVPNAENTSSTTEDNTEDITVEGSVVEDDVDGSVSQMQAAIIEKNLSEPPLYCPGCRHLLPASGRERGVVKWYNRRKGYGFIIRQSAPEIYVNRAALRRGHLRPDEFVEFEVTENQQGPAATKVTLLKGEQSGEE